MHRCPKAIIGKIQHRKDQLRKIGYEDHSRGIERRRCCVERRSVEVDDGICAHGAKAHVPETAEALHTIGDVLDCEAEEGCGDYDGSEASVEGQYSLGISMLDGDLRASCEKPSTPTRKLPCSLSDRMPLLRLWWLTPSLTEILSGIQASSLGRGVRNSQKTGNSVTNRDQRRLSGSPKHPESQVHAKRLAQIEEDDDGHERHAEVQLTSLRLGLAQTVLHLKDSLFIEISIVLRCDRPIIWILCDSFNIARVFCPTGAGCTDPAEGLGLPCQWSTAEDVGVVGVFGGSLWVDDGDHIASVLDERFSVSGDAFCI